MGETVPATVGTDERKRDGVKNDFEAEKDTDRIETDTEGVL